MRGRDDEPPRECGAIRIEVPDLPANMSAWWNEDGLVGVSIVRYTDGDVRDEGIVSLAWNDEMNERQNKAGAAILIGAWLRGYQRRGRR